MLSSLFLSLFSLLIWNIKIKTKTYLTIIIIIIKIKKNKNKSINYIIILFYNLIFRVYIYQLIFYIYFNRIIYSVVVVFIIKVIEILYLILFFTSAKRALTIFSAFFLFLFLTNTNHHQIIYLLKDLSTKRFYFLFQFFYKIIY